MVVPKFIYFSHKELSQDIGTIQREGFYPFYSEGNWSQHELFLYLLGITGPCEVWLSTFAISEVSIRSFASGIEEKLITQLHCIFDHTIKKNKLDLLFFASNIVTDITVTNNHSKMFLLKNDDWQIAVVGSANMTPNPRKETGCIFTMKEVFDKYLVYFEKSKQSGLKVEF